MKNEEFEYVGFWPRVGATLLDTILLFAVMWPLLTFIYGWEYWTSTEWVVGRAEIVINWALPAILAIGFWRVKQATPGKMAVSARIIDARTGRPASTKRLLVRYIAYYVSFIPLGLGVIWVAFDARRQGWHDKIAGTVVVRKKNHGPAPVTFEETSPSR